MKKMIDKFVNSDIVFDKKTIEVLGLVFFISGIFGWVYEFIFYYFNGGMKIFYMQGGNFLPWINIYGLGSLLILFCAYKFRKKPWLVFLIAMISTGLLEYFTGLVILKFFNRRLWDYNVEILNFGNIGGFVCLRSVLFFGLSGLLLMYVIVPFILFLSEKIPTKTFLIISMSLCCLVLIDEFYNLLFARIWSLPRAADFYKGLGFKYVEFK